MHDDLFQDDAAMDMHTSPHPTPTSSQRRRWSINITPVERGGRIVVGVAIIAAALVLLTSATSGLAVVLELLLAATGLDLAVTGATGHCPLYQKLGFVPKPLRKSS